MAGMAKITIIGNLGSDPEMRYLPSGDAVTNFSVAVSRRYKTRDGEDREETDWYRVSCFRRLAEVANEYLNKGKQVYIEGRPRLHTWDDTQTGEKRARIEIEALEMQMLGSRGDSGAEGRGGPSSAPANNDFDNMPF
jgi:single-strand DNA-binding protein